MHDKYLIPSAILAAGLIIAGAVIYVAAPKLGSNNAEVAGNEEQINRLSESNLVRAAQKVGVDKNEFEKCVAERRYQQKISDSLLDAVNSGGRGTPYSVIINQSGMAFPVEGGALAYAQLKSLVDAVISGSASNANPQIAQSIKPITGEDHIFGNSDAPIKIVEFSDLECPFCQKFHPTVKQIVEDYDGQVTWVYRHFPLESIHSYARPAAEASECVAELGGNDAFWQYLDLLFEV